MQQLIQEKSVRRSFFKNFMPLLGKMIPGTLT